MLPVHLAPPAIAKRNYTARPCHGQGTAVPRTTVYVHLHTLPHLALRADARPAGQHGLLQRPHSIPQRPVHGRHQQLQQQPHAVAGRVHLTGCGPRQREGVSWCEWV